MFKLHAEFPPALSQIKTVERLSAGLQQQYAHQTLLGVTGAGKTYTIAQLIAKTQRPALILAPNKTLAAQLYGEMKSFFPENSVEYFVSYYDYYQPEAYVPSSDTFIEKDASINTYIEQMRLAATKAMTTRKDSVIVASVSAIYGLGDPEIYKDMALELYPGQQIGQRHLIRTLVDLQYKRSKLTLERAQFRVHGDIIDVYPAESEQAALRVHLFDDEIEKLELFDPLTGSCLEELSDKYYLFPKSHYVTPKHRMDATVDLIKQEMKQRVAWFESEQKWIEAQRISQRCQYDIEMMLELGYCNGVENYSRYLSGRSSGEAPPTLLDYLPNETLIIIDESHVTVPQISGMYAGDRARKKNLVDYGFRLPSALDNRPLNFQEFEALSFSTVYVSATPREYELEKSQQVVELLVRPTGLLDPKVDIRPAQNQVLDLLGEIKQVLQQKQRVLVTTLTKKMAEQLAQYLHEQGIRVRYLHSSIDTVERVEILRDLRLGVFDVLVGINLLREGLDLPEVSLVAILDADKEGFLRSQSSLIQTVGRAARNLNGKAILYADVMTGSIERALAEMSRRREIQIAYNQEHSISPEAISKAVQDIMPIGQGPEKKKSESTKDSVLEKLHGLSNEQIMHYIASLEKTMHAHVEQLEFEQAAKIRDQCDMIRKWMFKQ